MSSSHKQSKQFDCIAGFEVMEENWYTTTIEMVDRGYRRFCQRRGLNPNEWEEQREISIRTAQAERKLNRGKQT